MSLNDVAVSKLHDPSKSRRLWNGGRRTKPTDHYPEAGKFCLEQGEQNVPGRVGKRNLRKEFFPDSSIANEASDVARIDLHAIVWVSRGSAGVAGRITTDIRQFSSQPPDLIRDIFKSKAISLQRRGVTVQAIFGRRFAVIQRGLLPQDDTAYNPLSSGLFHFTPYLSENAQTLKISVR